MKITTFNPLILAKDAEKTIRLFEELGFEKRHTPTVDAGDTSYKRFRMKDANGFHIDITGVDDIPQDITAIRINVDDFDEAYEVFTARGFQKVPGVDELELKTAKIMLMRSNSGITIELVHHIKK